MKYTWIIYLNYGSSILEVQFKYTWAIPCQLSQSLHCDPFIFLWSFYRLILSLKYEKPENFSILAPTVSNIWVLKVLHNFTLCPILKAIEIVKSPIKDPEKWKNQKMLFFYFLSPKHSWIEWLGDDWQKVSKIRSQLHTYSLSTFQWRFKNLQTSSCCKLFSNLKFSVAWKNYQKSQIFIVLVNFQDIENEDCYFILGIKNCNKNF